MKLRLKATLAILAVGLVMRWTFFGFRAEMLRQARDDPASSFTLAHMQLGGRQRCEASPASWQEVWQDPRDDGRTRIALFAYDSSFRSRHPGAPTIDPTLSGRLTGDIASVSLVRQQAGRLMEDVLVRTPWIDGPCAGH